LDDPSFAKLVADLTHNRCITVYITDLTLQDIMAIPDHECRAQLQNVISTLDTESAPLPAVLVSEEPRHARPTYPGEVYPVSQEDWELLNRLKVDDRADARQALAAKWLFAFEGVVGGANRILRRGWGCVVARVGVEVPR
jgi:hypothetical protein